MIVHINGMPGVGKLTVAKLLERSLPARLIDNHRLIDVATTCTDHGTPEYLEMLDKITALVLEKLRSRPEKETIIFTNALAAELPEDVDRLNKIADFSNACAVPFVPIVLKCSIDQNRKRLTETDRAVKGKLMDVKVLDELQQYTILHLQNHRHALMLDTTDLSPEQTAAAIQRHLRTIKE